MSRLVACVFAVIALVVASMTPAVASPSVGLSRDGVSFGPSLDPPLFDPGIRWVPGDTRSASFYVRNQARDDADVAIDVLGVRTDSLLDTGDLTVSARGGGGAWSDVTSPGTHRLVSRVDVPAGNSTRVDVTVAFASESSNASELRRLDLDIRVLLSQDVGDLVTGGGSGLLPDTGAPALWSLIASLILMAGGSVLVQGHRQKENSHV